MVLKRFKFIYKRKRIEMDVKECNSILFQTFGLMFRKKSKPLLFVFKKKTNMAIHSFFCRPFIAIWFMDDKIIGKKLIYPWRFHIKPKEKFNKLLEIPSNNENFRKIFRRAQIHDDRKV